MEGTLIAAREWDAGKISGQQYTEETKALRAEFAEKVFAKQRADQCGRIMKAMLNPWLDSPAAQTLLLERARKLQCV